MLDAATRFIHASAEVEPGFDGMHLASYISVPVHCSKPR